MVYIHLIDRVRGPFGLSCTDLAALGPYCQDLGPSPEQTLSIRDLLYDCVYGILIDERSYCNVTQSYTTVEQQSWQLE